MNKAFRLKKLMECQINQLLVIVKLQNVKDKEKSEKLQKERLPMKNDNLMTTDFFTAIEDEKLQ